jgi:guanine deaminase
MAVTSRPTTARSFASVVPRSRTVRALDLPIGLLKPGYRFDALLVDTAVPDTDLRLYDHDNQVDILQKIIWDTSRPNIKKVWVDGRLVKG